MTLRLPRRQYADLYGPTTGDRVRLADTELLIRDAMEKIMRNRTCLLIAHRLSTIRNADRIIVLHHGKVRETGRHAELMEKKGIYHRLYQLQYEREVLKQVAPDVPRVHE